MIFRNHDIPTFRRVTCGSLLVLAGLLTGVAAGNDGISKEYQLKAAFLYNFSKFVEWPERAFSSPESPLIIGVFRANPFGGELEKAVGGRRIKGRAIVVTLVPTAAAARQTHLLFVGAGHDSRLAELKEALRGSGVLTVGETEAFASHGGMITFKLQSDSLRFAINKGPAQQAGLKISAQLQKLAAQPGGRHP